MLELKKMKYYKHNLEQRQLIFNCMQIRPHCSINTESRRDCQSKNIKDDQIIIIQLKGKHLFKINLFEICLEKVTSYSINADTVDSPFII